jgi:1,2-dihydroxy-3-keto-5-methylthiopentene dioxygenase
MTVLRIPDRDYETRSVEQISSFLRARGIDFARWEANASLAKDASQESVLSAYREPLDSYMKAHGYVVADVVVLHEDTPNLPAIRAKFLAEHTHSEDEVRLFVEGAGDFWFHLGRSPAEVFCVRCEQGDLISVPAGTTHWFDCGETPFVKAVRMFVDPAGWVPTYTGSGIEQRYSPLAKGGSPVVKEAANVQP